MKNFILILGLSISMNAFSKITASEAVKTILPNGTYVGNGDNGSCVVNVNFNNTSATISIETEKEADAFAILNSSNKYSYNETTKEFKASAALNFPRYENGGTKYLFIRSIDENVVRFDIVNSLLDHQGNDASTYLNCKILK